MTPRILLALPPGRHPHFRCRQKLPRLAFPLFFELFVLTEPFFRLSFGGLISCWPRKLFWITFSIWGFFVGSFARFNLVELCC